MKLVKLLANLGYGSRKEVAQLVRDGLVTDAEDNVLDLDTEIDPEKIRVAGEPLQGISDLPCRRESRLRPPKISGGLRSGPTRQENLLSEQPRTQAPVRDDALDNDGISRAIGRASELEAYVRALLKAAVGSEAGGDSLHAMIQSRLKEAPFNETVHKLFYEIGDSVRSPVGQAIQA